MAVGVDDEQLHVPPFQIEIQPFLSWRFSVECPNPNRVRRLSSSSRSNDVSRAKWTKNRLEVRVTDDGFVLHAEEERRTLRSSFVTIRIGCRCLDEESASVHDGHHIEWEEQAEKLCRSSASFGGLIERNVVLLVDTDLLLHVRLRAMLVLFIEHCLNHILILGFILREGCIDNRPCPRIYRERERESEHALFI